MSSDRAKLRAMTRGAYDLQKLRIQTGLRLCANFRSRLGQSGGESEDDLDDEAKEILARLRDSYRRLTDGVARNRKLPTKQGFTGDDLISDYNDLIMADQYIRLEETERRAFGFLETALDEFRIYTEFLKPVRGCGPAMSAVIISEYDIHKARYPSSLWAYGGLDVAADGRGRSRRKEHLVKREYIDRAGKQAERDGITYNPFLKTKLMGVLAGSFLRMGSPYAKVYYDYRHRLESDPRREKVTLAEYKKTAQADAERARGLWTPGRINDAAKRYMVKMFLLDLYKAWRPIEGLEVAPSYHEAKLGHVHRDAA
jgi:hypothetical protein